MTAPALTLDALNHKHPEYVKLKPKWDFTYDYYTGDVLDDTKLRSVPYLIRRALGESDKAYDERARLADYSNHFATVVDGLVGMLFSAEEQATRVWTDENASGFGDPAKDGSKAFLLTVDADGKGTSWATVWRQLAIELSVLQRVWVLVDNVNDRGVVKYVCAQQVTDWLETETGVVEALLEETVDTRDALFNAAERQYVHFTTEGWRRVRTTSTGLITLDEGTYAYVTRSGAATLPIFPVKLPMRRYVGWSLAKKAHAMFNMESARDNLLRIANFPRLVIAGGDEFFKATLDTLAKGATALQDDPSHAKTHGYIAPSSEPATIASETLKRKVEEFYVVAFREYGDAARERTATEVRQDVAAGAGAFLTLLKTAVDEAENGALWRLAQLEFPTDRTQWASAHVERADTFAPVDMNIVLEQMRTRYFGTTGQIPVGRDAEVEVARQAAKYDGLPADDAQIKAQLAVQHLMDLLPVFDKLPTPARVKAALAIRFAEATGLIPIDDKNEDGDPALRKELLAEAELIAQGELDAKSREAELPAFGAMEQLLKPKVVAA